MSKKNSIVFALLALLALVPFPSTLIAQVGVSGVIPAGTVWTGTVTVTSDLQIEGLTIEPGVQVLIDGDYQIVVEGTVQCLGTPDLPVVFKPAPGSTTGWQGFFFEDTIGGSEFSWTEIEGTTSTAVRLVRSSPTFDNVTFRGNVSAALGGALRVTLLDEDVILNSCLFEQNRADTAGGAIHVVGPADPSGPSVVLNGCIFRSNRAGTVSIRRNTKGGALYVDGNLHARQCTFIRNEARAYTIYASGGRYTQGGAIFATGGRTEVLASTFLENACRMGAHSQTPDASRAYGGTIYHASGELSVLNCLLANNFLTVSRNPVLRGAGLYVAAGTSSIVNSTLVENSHRAVYRSGGSVDILNSILFRNNNSGSQIAGASGVTATYSDIQNGFDGEGNFAMNPVLDSYYRIAPPSPGVDAGHPDAQHFDSIPPGLGGLRNDAGHLGGSEGFLWDTSACHLDADGDGFGSPDLFAFMPQCAFNFVSNDLDCDDSDPGVFPGSDCVAPSGVSGFIPAGTVWTDTVTVTSDLRIAGLTVEPGAQVLIDGDYQVVVEGTMQCLGTPDLPVVFKPAPGSTTGWRGFFFEDTIGGSEFLWTEIEGTTSTAVRLVRSSPSFDNVTFRGNVSPALGGALRVTLLDADVVLNSCLFEQNRADTAGGAIHVVGPADPSGPSVVLNGCIFRSNRAGTVSIRRNTKGGALYVDGNLHARQCTFIRNEARAYTIYASGGRYTQGGAIFATGGRTEVLASTFLENACRMGAHSQTPDASRAYGGTIYQAAGELSVLNCLLANNFLTVSRNPVLRGAGLYVAAGTSSIVNSTLVENSHRAVYRSGGNVEILNSILFRNNNSGSQIAGASGVIATYSDIQNGFDGEGNFASNPVLDAYYRIIPPSPGVDAGHPDAQYFDTVPPGLGGLRNDAGHLGGSEGFLWDTSACHLDADGDGFGSPDLFAFMPQCEFNFVSNDLDCDDSDPGVFPGSDCVAPSGVFGFIPAGTVWTGTVTVTSDLRIAGLTVEPGTEVLIDGDYQIVVDGTVQCLGTPNLPVVFKPTPGSTTGWRGFFFEDTIGGSEFQWTEIEGTTSTAMRLVRSSPTFDNVTFRGNVSPALGGALRATLLDEDVTLNSCLFEQNRADTAGGAIHVVGPADPSGASVVLNGCIFRNNHAGTLSIRRNTKGGALYVDGNVNARQCTFTENEARAYTIYASGGRYTQGGAIFATGGRTEVLASTFLENACRMGAHSQTPDASRAYGGTIYQASGELRVLNCLLANNFLTVARNPVLRGAGLYVAYGTSSIVNSTLVENSHRAVYRNGGGVEICNSILFDNNNSASQIAGASGVTATYSDIQNGFDGEGNIDLAPLFVDPGNGDFHIQFNSPCVNLGNNSVPSLPSMDLDGTARVVCGIVDIGADEVPEPPGGCSAILIRGDIDADGRVAPLVDVPFMLAFGFNNGPAPPCMDAADVNDDGVVTPIVDAIYLLQHYFLGGTPPPSPYRCGSDPTPDLIGCGSYACP